jgi:MFS family permease
MIRRLRNILNAYPRQFWVLVIGMLVNATGINLAFPFISLYLHSQLDFAMTHVGGLIAAFWLVSILSQVVGGGLVDRIGRKPIMVFSLVVGASATLTLGLAQPSLAHPGVLRNVLLPVLVILMGLSGGLFYPAVNSMTADLIPSEQRTRAYGLLRVVYNLGVAIGPAVGGFIANSSYLALFLSAAGAFSICSVLIAFATHETRPGHGMPHSDETNVRQLVESFRVVWHDNTMVIFGILYFLSMLVYSQMNTTLPVYLQKFYGIQENWYGLMMSMNAVMVVVLQYPLSLHISRYSVGVGMAIGTAFFAVGFGLFGFVGAIPLFFLAQAIWTVGEMITTPVSQTFVAEIAPAHQRGNYMGFYGLSWGLAYGIGPLLGGLALDYLSGHEIWYVSLGLDLIVTIAFLAYRKKIQLTIKERMADHSIESSNSTHSNSSNSGSALDL